MVEVKNHKQIKIPLGSVEKNDKKNLESVLGVS